MRTLYILLVAALLALCSFPALAQTPPAPTQYNVLSLSRLAIAAGGQYDWNAGETAPVGQEFAAGGHAGYVLTTHLSLAAHAIYGFDSRSWRIVPALHYRLPDGITKTGSVAFEAAYQYFGGQNIPTFQHEWAAGVIWAMPVPGTKFLIGASEVYGFDNRIWRTSVGLQFPIWLGRNS